MTRKANTASKAVDDIVASIELQHQGAATPLYAQLANGLLRGIENGGLLAGDRLPAHRDLASALSVNITTVTRAIAHLKKIGLVESRPGRGTVVGSGTRQPETAFQSAPMSSGSGIDLSVNRPPTNAYLGALERVLRMLPKDPRFSSVQDYQPSEGPVWARAATTTWLRSIGVIAQPAQLVLVEGAQHGLASVLRAITNSGDVVLADRVCYQGINALCRTLGLHLHGVSGDDQGMRPTDLEVACKTLQPRVLFLNPTLNNPTVITVSEERRRQLIEVATRHNLLIIEDDVYRPFLDNGPPPLFNMAPDRVFYVTGLSKCAAPGLRFGVVAAPSAYAEDVAAALRVDCWSISPLTALIATCMIESGELQTLVQTHAAELRERNLILQNMLAGQKFSAAAVCTHAWLQLPEPWRGSDFTRVCHDNGVELLPGAAFTLRHEPPPHTVRINLAAARSRTELQKALKTIVDLLYRGHCHFDTAI
jgi:DNA-binding transcriptional MocR family regulator